MSDSKTSSAGNASLRDLVSVYEKARDSGKLEAHVISTEDWIKSLREMSDRLGALKIETPFNS